MAAAVRSTTTHPSQPLWNIYTFFTNTQTALLLALYLLVHLQLTLVSGETTTKIPTTGSTQEDEISASVTSHINEISSTEEGHITTSPWPPDEARGRLVSTHRPVTEDERLPEVNKVDKTVTTADPLAYTAGYDVMKSVTFQVTLGVCMSLVGILLVFLVLMMIYTKYRGWKDRMNIAPTVRTGSQVGTDRQELMT